MESSPCSGGSAQPLCIISANYRNMGLPHRTWACGVKVTLTWEGPETSLDSRQVGDAHGVESLPPPYTPIPTLDAIIRQLRDVVRSKMVENMRIGKV